MKRFNSKALYDALNEQRLARNLAWRAVADEIGVSVTTITRLKDSGRTEADGMLAMVDWLAVPIETFVHHSAPSTPTE